jgi:F5/8 type C domain-containing protein
MRRRSVAFGLAAVLYTALTAALTWPLVLSPGSTVPNDLGDPLLNTFLIAWNARTTPLTDRWWNLPQFYPQPGVTSYSEHLLGLAVLTTPIIKVTGNPLLAYNAAFFLSFVLCALSAHLLAYVLTQRHDAGVLAGLAFAFAPYRMAQLAHIQVLSAYWIPLALTGLHLYFAERRGRWLALFAVAWLMQALTCGYYLFYLSVLVAFWLIWFAIGRERWADIGRVLAVWAVAALAMTPIAYGYVKYQRAYGLRRWPDEIAAFSADVASLLKAPDSGRLWGWLNVIDRPESALFPGLTVVFLAAGGLAIAWVAASRSGTGRLAAARWFLAGAALAGLIAATPGIFGPWKLQVAGLKVISVTTARKPLSLALLLAATALLLHPSVRTAWRRRSPLAFYALATVLMWLFSLGPSPTLMDRPFIYKAPYSWLLMLPGVDGVRVPARFWVLATLCLAIAAALALAQMTERWPRLRSWLPALACTLVLLEAWPRPIHVLPRPASRPVHTPAVARLEVPANPARDAIVLFRAAEHRRPVVNGYSGYFAPHYWALQYLLEQKDPAVLARLSSMGTIEAVVDHQLDGDRRWRTFLGSDPQATVVHSDPEYTAYRIGRSGPASASALPQMRGAPLPIAAVTASRSQDLVGHMTDGDRITRWHTGGPQDPTNQVTVDLGATRAVGGVEEDIGGYIADFPRFLIIDTSADGATWVPAWSGGTALVALSSAIEEPLNIPLRFPFPSRPARYVRLRQTGADDVYYWSIAELRVYGDP